MTGRRVRIWALCLVIGLGCASAFWSFYWFFAIATNDQKMRMVNSDLQSWRTGFIDPDKEFILSNHISDRFSRRGLTYHVQIGGGHLIVLSRGPNQIFDSFAYSDEVIEPNSFTILSDDIGMIVDIRAARENREEP